MGAFSNHVLVGMSNLCVDDVICDTGDHGLKGVKDNLTEPINKGKLYLRRMLEGAITTRKSIYGSSYLDFIQATISYQQRNISL